MVLLHCVFTKLTRVNVVILVFVSLNGYVCRPATKSSQRLKRSASANEDKLPAKRLVILITFILSSLFFCLDKTFIILTQMYVPNYTVYLKFIFIHPTLVCVVSITLTK